jgi:hypothetical protein
MSQFSVKDRRESAAAVSWAQTTSTTKHEQGEEADRSNKRLPQSADENLRNDTTDSAVKKKKKKKPTNRTAW